jgi:hypothetical protein
MPIGSAALITSIGTTGEALDKRAIMTANCYVYVEDGLFGVRVVV